MGRLATLALAVMALGGTLNAGVIVYDNLSGTPLSNTEKVTSLPTLPSPPPNYGPLYNSFSTLPVAGGTLGEVVLDIYAINPSDGATTVAGLYANNSGAPGALVATVGTIADSGIASTYTDYTFHPASGIALSPGATYWIGLSSTSSADSVVWAMTGYSAGTGLSGQHYKDAVFGVKPDYPLFEMQVQENTTPEPGGYAILAFAIIALAEAKRRRGAARM